MTDTSTRQMSGNQFCGSCGAAVKSYWNSCPACDAPLAVRPVGSYEPSAASDPPAPPPPEPPARPARPSWASRSTETQSMPAWSPAPEPNAPAPAPTWSQRMPEPPPPAWSPPPAPAPAPAPAWSQPSYSAPTSYAAPPSYAPPPSYTPPPSTAQYPTADVSSSGSPTKKSRGPWMVIAIVLALLLIATGIFAGISASGESSAKTKLSDITAQLKTAKADLATSRDALKASDAKVSDLTNTNQNQSSQLGAYKACITDLNALFASTAGTAAATTADKQAQKDCVPLGLG